MAVATAQILNSDPTDRRLPEVDQPRWQRRYQRAALTTDTTAGLAALLASWLLSYVWRDIDSSLAAWQVALGLASVPVWLGVLGAVGSYEVRLIGTGTDEYRRILNAGLAMFAIVSTTAYFFRLDLARSFVLWSVPLAVLLSIAGRFLLRKRLHARWLKGVDVRRTLLVGHPDELELVAHHLEREAWAGFSVVGMCSTKPGDRLKLADGRTIEAYGNPSAVRDAVEHFAVDTLVLTSAKGLGPGGLRELTWDLEDSHIHLIVAPAVTDIAGPRISSRPVAGLPLLHVEAPRLSTAGRIFKATFDRVVTVVALVLLSPVMAGAAFAVKLTSRGPVFYRQTRVGLGGKNFTLTKFRTMVVDADAMRPSLAVANEAAGPLFKIRDDPRVTRVGKWLRRLSVDELPQLFQVLSGRMSLVGPRPPLPSEVATYDPHVHRKFLVKPGITGLWQVCGRSDLPWEEAVRLDLFYVDNWSPTMDIAICAKTVKAVLLPTGAY